MCTTNIGEGEQISLHHLAEAEVGEQNARIRPLSAEHDILRFDVCRRMSWFSNARTGSETHLDEPHHRRGCTSRRRLGCS